jgi:hypothetical protein
MITAYVVISKRSNGVKIIKPMYGIMIRLWHITIAVVRFNIHTIIYDSIRIGDAFNSGAKTINVEYVDQGIMRTYKLVEEPEEE